MNNNSIEVKLIDLIKTSSKDSKQNRDHYKFFRSVNSSLIHDIFKYRVFNNDFIDNIEISLDEENVFKDIKPSYDFYLRNLISILNLNDNYEDNEELTKKLLERIDKLLSIEKEIDLEIEFPKLYYDYISGRKYFYELQKYRRYTPEEEYKEKEHYFYACGLKRSLKNFVITQAKMYKRYILQRKELKEKQNNNTYNEYVDYYFDKEKLKLFIVYNLLIKIESNSINKNKYLRIVNNYLKNNRTNTTITIDDEVITVEDIRNRFNSLSNKFVPTEKQVNWQIIPSSKYQKKQFIKVKEPQITIMNYQEIERLIKLGQEKQEFYEQSNYYAKAIGLRNYSGYVAYIYENGEVILDKEFKINRPRSASGNAIYNMKINEFRALSRLDKKELKKHPNVKRICHTKNWKDKVNEIIERKASPEEIESTHEYVYYLK